MIIIHIIRDIKFQVKYHNHKDTETTTEHIFEDCELDIKITHIDLNKVQ